jgi:hypothetical protein
MISIEEDELDDKAKLTPTELTCYKFWTNPYFDNWLNNRLYS